MKQRVSRALRSVLRRSVFPSTAGRRKSKGANATGRAAIDSDAQRGYTYQYNRRGRNVTVGARKFSDLRCEAPDTAHTNRSHSTSKERIFQNHKKHKITLSPLVILLCCAPSRSPRRGLSEGWCTHRQADRPLPRLAAAALALPVATRKTTRLSRQSPLLFVQNAPPFATPPHAGDTTRALASALQSRCISCLHPSPSHLSI